MAGNIRIEASGIKPNYDVKVNGDHSSVLEEIKGVKIKFMKKTKFHSIAEIRGINVAIANAIRRILLAEVPTLALETVQIYQNTGVIQDEVLAHRIGLIPFDVDPDKISFRNHDELSDKNSICFHLKVKCRAQDVVDRPNMPVYASDMKWLPLSEAQAESFKDNPPKPVHGDILLTKLRPGQEIDLKAYLEKGIGRTHAKWSPVCTAVYRFKPQIEFSEEDPLNEAEESELCDLCPMGVFSKKNGELTVENPLNCTSCRACVERFPKRVIIKKLSDHLICKFESSKYRTMRLTVSVESTGAIPSSKLFLKAIEILKDKAIQLRKRLSGSTATYA